MPGSREKDSAKTKRRYHAYKRLCDETGVVPQYWRWSQHYTELRCDPRPRRLTKAEHFAFWREHLTDQEIREVGPYLDFLDREREAA